MDCSLPGSSVHGILQAIILSGMPFLSPGDLPNPGIEPMSPALAGGFFTTEPPGQPNLGRLSMILPIGKCTSVDENKGMVYNTSVMGILAGSTHMINTTYQSILYHEVKFTKE